MLVGKKLARKFVVSEQKCQLDKAC